MRAGAGVGHGGMPAAGVVFSLLPRAARAAGVRRPPVGGLPALLATRASGAAIRSRLSHINANRAIVEHVAVELGDGGLRGRVVGHLYEAEAFALAGGPVRRDGRFADLTIRAKECEQVLVVRRERQTSNVDASRHDGPFPRSMWRGRPWGDGIETTQSHSVCAPLQAFVGRSVERCGGLCTEPHKNCAYAINCDGSIPHGDGDGTAGRRGEMCAGATALARGRAGSGAEGVSEAEPAGL